MTKRLVSIVLILFLVVGALSAVTMPNAASALLKATLGEYLTHGFVVSGQSAFQSSIEVTNAFGPTAPSFTYGYETNGVGPYYFRMTVSDFVSSSGTVKIKSLSATGATLTWDSTNSAYLVFTVPQSNTFSRSTATITVNPALLSTDTTDHRGVTFSDVYTAAKAPAGDYTATITFSVSAS